MPLNALLAGKRLPALYHIVNHGSHLPSGAFTAQYAFCGKVIESVYCFILASAAICVLDNSPLRNFSGVTSSRFVG